jgi:hypothetical protein
MLGSSVRHRSSRFAVSCAEGCGDLEGRHLWCGVPQVQRRPRVGAERDDRLQLRAGDLVEQVVAPGWYPRCGFSYRDVEELLAARGVEVDHVTI